MSLVGHTLFDARLTASGECLGDFATIVTSKPVSTRLITAVKPA